MGIPITDVVAPAAKAGGEISALDNADEVGGDEVVGRPTGEISANDEAVDMAGVVTPDAE